MKDITLGYSPCPNDTFIFHALIHNKIPSGNLSFRETLLDVETLNQKALNAEFDVTKISYAALGHVRSDYRLLNAGGALGHGCGPLVVSKKTYDMKDLRNKSVAIPGKLTTAYLLLQLYDIAFKSSHIITMPFDEIMDSIAQDKVDAGVIIHESRFTYPSFGLQQVIDLGEWWEQETGSPIPLGGIVAKHSLGEENIQAVDSLVKNSIEYAYKNRDEAMPYIKSHAQELSIDVIRGHIDLYVNNYSLELGKAGHNAVAQLLSRSEQAGIV